MFNFFKKRREEEEKKKSALDKIVMGAIIGTAIGSVIGLAVAPKKGKDTRGFLRSKIEKAKEAILSGIHHDRSNEKVKKIPRESFDPSPPIKTIQRNTIEDLEP